MQITKSQWKHLLELEKEFKRRDETLSRGKISEVLKVSENTAKGLQFALENKDVITLKPDSFDHAGKKELVISDLHQPFTDQLALNTVLERAHRFQPDIIVLLGDIIDFFKISRFPEAKKKKKKSVKEEMETTKKFLEELRYQFPGAEIIYYEGNHEDRLTRYIIQNATEIQDLIENLLQEKLDLYKNNIKYVTEPFQIGKLWHLHGHEKPTGGHNPEYVTNVVFKVVLDNFICGHFHRSQTKPFKGISNIYQGLANGHLFTRMDWALLNNWNQSFFEIQYDQKGHFRAEEHKIYKGEIF